MPCPEEFRSSNRTLNEQISELDECCYYVVEVSCFRGNPPFLAILYTGFKAGGYRTIHCNSAAFEPDNHAVIRVVSRIGKFNFDNTVS